MKYVYTSLPPPSSSLSFTASSLLSPSSHFLIKPPFSLLIVGAHVLPCFLNSSPFSVLIVSSSRSCWSVFSFLFPPVFAHMCFLPSFSILSPTTQPLLCVLSFYPLLVLLPPYNSSFSPVSFISSFSSAHFFYFTLLMLKVET